ncbi:MAG TPA: enoyl-CoA hydratase-related protein [Actinomycetes bacterium]|nr:enoyl-CoA hydratase-related protein [Actinomycetes bacterium]
MTVHTDISGSALIVTLDVPKANAVNVETSLQLYGAFARLRDDDALRVGIVTGAGERFFSAGWDLKAAAEGEAVDADHSPGGFAGLTEFFDIGKPVIAAVNGLAVGGGFELALAADLVVAADHAEFALPEVRLGIVADSGGLLRVPARVPRAVAMEWLLTGRRIPADEAARWGLVTRVVPAASLMDAALELAEAIEESAPLAVAAVLEVVRETDGLDVREGFQLLRSGTLPAYAAMLSSADADEGPRAFAERRPPVWRGR